MASGVTSQIKEEFLVCQICLEDYVNPKALPCQDTFCQNCLKQLVAKMGKLTCPNCRRECQLPQNGVEGLPSSFFVNKLRDIIRDGGGTGQTHHFEFTFDDKSATTSNVLDGRLDSNRETTANYGHTEDTSGAAAQHTGPTPGVGAGQSTRSEQSSVRVFLPSGGFEAIDDFFVRLCSTRYIHPDRVLPILSSLKGHDIMTSQDLHDNWDDVKDMVDMTKAMRQHITEALMEFFKAGH